ncbi:MAG: outer membrane lipoprotein-sorting protein [Candidatus Neomarinimicrobiota bacterium]|nr:outer membrane lipoprotein-sorting protein [Candidatus Neomarinimicrobiota bacterium]
MIRKVSFGIILLTVAVSFGQSDEITAEELVNAMDKNLNARTRVLTSKMIVHGRRSSRTIESRNWVKGINQAYTEYLAPPREAGTKMLKSGDKLWTYSPQTDRVIQISGHMLRQSVMGSDMSYNDMMEDRPLTDLYKATVEGSEVIEGRKHWILFLEARVTGLSYPKRRAWVDAEYLLPLKEELYAKSGKLLKSTSMDGIKKVQGRWFPTRFIFNDELKRNSRGTEWIIDDIAFDKEIPDSRFEKAMLRK